MSNYGTSSHENDTYDFATSTTYGYTSEPVSNQLHKNPVDNWLAVLLNFILGYLHMWMVVLGYLTYTWYPGLIQTDTWWKAVCPTTAWTSATLTASATNVTIGPIPAPTATIIQVAPYLNNMTQAICLSGAPIRQWTGVAML